MENKESGWIDIHDDDVMRANGLWRPYDVTPRDPSVWTKTNAERKLIKKLRGTWKGLDLHFHNVPRKFIQVPGKLIIQLKKNKTYPKTTYSIKCWQSDIPEILAKYTITDKKTKTSITAVAKYKWNGKTYSPAELPFWG